MLTRTRKRSAHITLVLLGAAALSACDHQSERRDVYASKQDCVHDWGDEKKCETAPDSAAPAVRAHSGGGFFWGPLYSGGNRYGSGSSSALSSSRSGSRAIGSSSSSSSSSSSISRGGFGSSSSAHGSSGS